jgi:hypothetical protein
MYGLVNRAVEDMAREAGGEALWDRLRHRAGVQDEHFLAMRPYDDDLTFRLVHAAARELDLPVDEVLRRFGRHWITYTGRHGYGPLLAMGGRSLPQFLANLDAMHSRIALSMPELRPPSFDIIELAPDLFRVVYRSHRSGLGPMVQGLLEGLGEMFATPVAVTPVADPDTGHDTFEVRHG